MGDHRRKEISHRLAPFHERPHCMVEGVLRPSHCQLQKRPAFLQVPRRRSWPQGGGPALGLETRMQLADVVKEDERGEALAVHIGERRTRRRLQPPAPDRRTPATAQRPLPHPYSDGPASEPGSPSVLPHASRIMDSVTLLVQSRTLLYQLPVPGPLPVCSFSSFPWRAPSYRPQLPVSRSCPAATAPEIRHPGRAG